MIALARIAAVLVISSFLSARSEEKIKALETLDALPYPTACLLDSSGTLLQVAFSGAKRFGSDDEKYLGYVTRQGSVKSYKKTENSWQAEELAILRLDAPLALAALPVKTERLPAGTLFAPIGSAYLMNADGEPLGSPLLLGTGVGIYDAQTRKALGKVDLGTGGIVARTIGHAALQPVGLCFDRDGNLYVLDTGEGGALLSPNLPSKPGLICVPHATLDKSLKMERHNDAVFLPIPAIPGAVLYHEAVDTLYVGTRTGDLHALQRGQFPLEQMPEPLAGDRKSMPRSILDKLGHIVALAGTDKGTLLIATTEALFVLPNGTPKNKESLVRVLNFEDTRPIALHLKRLDLGQNRLAIVEQGKTTDQGRIRICAIPEEW